MALSDGSATREQVLSAEKRVRLRREALGKAAALEAARTSEERSWTDETGTVWRYVVLDEAEARIQKCEPAVTDLVVPDELEGKPVVSLAPDACAYLESVETIHLPDSILSIGFSAFRECRKLRSIHFPCRRLTPTGCATASRSSGWSFRGAWERSTRASSTSPV